MKKFWDMWRLIVWFRKLDNKLALNDIYHSIESKNIRLRRQDVIYLYSLGITQNRLSAILRKLKRKTGDASQVHVVHDILQNLKTQDLTKHQKKGLNMAPR